MAGLDAILNDIDADLDNALERLFAFLRIPSISTDPAYAGQCREAAAWLAADLTALGFATSVEETSLHPVVLAHKPKPGAPHVLFYGHTTCSRSIRSTSGRTRPSSRASPTTVAASESSPGAPRTTRVR